MAGMAKDFIGLLTGFRAEGIRAYLALGAQQEV